MSQPDQHAAMPSAAGPRTFRNHVDGRWVEAGDGRTFEQRNPADLDDVTGLWPAGTRADATAAIDAAERAFAGWRRLTPFDRAAMLGRALDGMRRRRDEIAAILTRENGKTLRESLGEIDAAIREMEFQIHEGVRLGGRTVASSSDGVFAYSTRQPLGVVSIISPWNFPFNVPARKLTPALMAGNTCVFKPASLTPHTGLALVELFIEAGLPPGVVNLVTGGGGTVGEELITNPRIRAVSFTGSTDVGLRIQQSASRTLARTQLEMGGKNPLVVLDDADLEAAAAAAATAAFACAGQWCTSTSRAIVMRGVAAEFTDRVVALARQVVLGAGTDSRTTMGPVCGTAQLRSILDFIAAGERDGARLLVGGGRATAGDLAKGCFVAPTVFGDVRPEMTIAREEIFGPVLSILVVDSFDEAIDLANDVPFGLASSVFTRDLGRALTFLERTEVGLTHVNLLTSLKEPQLSFGGIKMSGAGLPEAGSTGIEFFTEHKVAYVKYRG